MNDFSGKIIDYLQSSPDLTARIIESVAIILLIWLIRFIVIRIVGRQTTDKRLQYKWRKNLTYIGSSIGILVIGQIWFSGVESLATFLGLLSAGIAIALKDPVTDLAAWLFIIWRKPFDVGDRIQIGNSKGDVIDMPRLMSAIHVVLVLGTCATAGSAVGTVWTVKIELYPHLSNLNRFKLQGVQDGRISKTGFSSRMQGSTTVSQMNKWIGFV